jgi:hypothetical protein
VGVEAITFALCRMPQFVLGENCFHSAPIFQIIMKKTAFIGICQSIFIFVEEIHTDIGIVVACCFHNPPKTEINLEIPCIPQISQDILPNCLLN